MGNELETKETVNINDFEWPELPDTSEQDQKVIARLERVAACDPTSPDKQLAVENAKQLRELIPRAKALKWEIFLYRDAFGYLTWDEKGSAGHLAPYAVPNGAKVIKNCPTQFRKQRKPAFWKK